MTRAFRLLAIVPLLACASAQADGWDAVAGRWSGSGEVRGMPAAVELEFGPALDGRAHHLRFRNRMTMPDGQARVFLAEAFYLCGEDGVCRGHWYDNRGVVLPLSARAIGDQVLVEWGDDTTERGRTTYRVDGDRLRVIDEVQGRDGSWNTFGTVSAKRAGIAPPDP